MLVDRKEYLNKPLKIMLNNIEPVYLYFACNAIQERMDGTEELPAIFDYTQEFEDGTKKPVVSFVVYETKQHLVIKKLDERERHKYE